MRELRIHGDNIVECTRALELLASSLRATVTLVDSPPYAPLFHLVYDIRTKCLVQLVPGYGRWGFSFPDYLRGRGARLREATDAIITEISQLDDEYVLEEPIVSFEFCGALPAGNNAWQRTGRALAMAEADLPYIYYAEIGGLELDSNRQAKAPRWPNPLVPFAYIEIGDVLGTLTIPVFLKSPTASDEVIKPFEQTIDNGDSLDLLASLMSGSIEESVKNSLRKKAILAVKQLANQRKRNDTIKGKDWEEFEALDAGAAKADWLIKKGMKWNKKLGIKILTKSFPLLLAAVQDVGCVAPGAQDIPFCILPSSKRKDFADELVKIYGNKLSEEFLSWLKEGDSHLVLVWVAGFKPRGDDSRPDRGLVPLARMIFGFEDIDLISVIYGPAKKAAWSKLENNPDVLAQENGLWEALIGLSDAIIVDSATSDELNENTFIFPKKPAEPKNVKLKSKKALVPHFGEQDIDTVLHLSFNAFVEYQCFEGMCNPPGGDWSGLSYLDFKGNKEFRWTSLPRVSGKDAKRPDHVIQFDGSVMAVLVIESKDTLNKLEKGIGPRLIKYFKDLTGSPPTVSREVNKDWSPNKDSSISIPNKVISCAAFQYVDGQDLGAVLKTGQVDLVIAVEFDANNKSATLHLIGDEAAQTTISLLVDKKGCLPDSIKIEVH